MVALAWVGAATLTGTVAWSAVAVIADDRPRTGVLTQAEVSQALTSAQATSPATGAPTTATPTPTPSPTATETDEPTPSPTATETDEPSPSASASTPAVEPTTAPTTATPRPSTTPPPPEPTTATVAATWHVTGGTVSVECTGSRISLLTATPDNGWTMEVGSRGPEKVEVELHRSEQETKLVARCSDGAPIRSVSSDDGEDHESEHESEDD